MLTLREYLIKNPYLSDDDLIKDFQEYKASNIEDIEKYKKDKYNEILIKHKEVLDKIKATTNHYYNHYTIKRHEGITLSRIDEVVILERLFDVKHPYYVQIKYSYICCGIDGIIEKMKHDTEESDIFFKYFKPTDSNNWNSLEAYKETEASLSKQIVFKFLQKDFNEKQDTLK